MYFYRIGGEVVWGSRVFIVERGGFRFNLGGLV